MKSKDLQHAQQLTAASFMKVFQQNTEELTRMHLDDVTELAQDMARIVPAGNVVTMVFSQLSSVKGKRVSGNETRQMMGLLKQGMSTFMDKGTYLAFYTTPAILISGYQKILEAAGKDPNSAFPNGTWQYYLEFGLREDAARHACETEGFQWAINREHLSTNEADQLAAWLMAVAWLIHSYDQLLMQEWRERIILREMAQAIAYPRIGSLWVGQRPYQVPADAPQQDYVRYRQAAFQNFVFEGLKARVREKQASKTIQEWDNNEKTQLRDTRSAYQDQMTIHATLEPDTFSDMRMTIPVERSQIAVQYRGNYFLIPVLHNGKRLDVGTMRALAQSILASKSNRTRTGLDEILVTIPREEQAQVRGSLPSEVYGNLNKLRHAPIILNWDNADSSQTLSEIRQGRRGIGDHALTLFRTDKSMVFDQSHIFFDAIWGMAIAEITTNQAVKHLRDITPLQAMPVTSLRPPLLDFAVDIPNDLRKRAQKSDEVSAEVTLNILAQFDELRRLMRQRHNELRLTVNDVLILYRSFYNQHYRPSKELLTALKTLAVEGNRRQQKAAQQALEGLAEVPKQLPAFLIPIDATLSDPKERIFPVTFRPQPPWTAIEPQHRETWEWLLNFQRAQDKNAQKQAWTVFNEARTRYLEMLRMYNVLMSRYKETTLAGDSMSTMTLKILATVPKRLQSWLSHIPDRIDLLNDMLKGTEVFSNVGRVSNDSSLTRFITAKDDNDKKVLCWGIMTRADGVMVITLRDFRPWVMGLKAAGSADVAGMITSDFLQGYAKGVHQFVQQLNQISRAGTV